MLALDEGQAHGGAGSAGLDDRGQADELDHPGEQRPGAEIAEGGGFDRRPSRRRDAGSAEALLHQHLVEGDVAGEWPRPRVREVVQFEQPLHRPVLAFLSVQGDVAGEDTRLLDRLDERDLRRVQKDGGAAARHQRVQDAVARA